MENFKRSTEFEKDLKRFGKKFPSIYEDLKSFEKIIKVIPLGVGKHFNVLHRNQDNTFFIVKARLACRSFQGSQLRIIYAFHKNEALFMYIDIYFKGDKVNEDSVRVEKYIKENKSTT